MDAADVRNQDWPMRRAGEGVGEQEPPFEWSVSQRYPALRMVADGYPFLTESYPSGAGHHSLDDFLVSVDLMLYAALAALALSLSALLLDS